MGREELLDLKAEHKIILKDILKKYLPHKTVWAYGSRVKGTATRVSDLDLVAFNAEELAVFDAKEALSESSLPFTVSILIWEELPDDFKTNIKAKYVVVQESCS